MSRLKRRLWLFALALLFLLLGIALGYWTLHIVWLEPCDLEDKPCLRRLQFGGAAAPDATIIALTGALWCAVKAVRGKGRGKNPSDPKQPRRRP